MSSQVFICNMALAHVGASSISSITEASAEARACNTFYDHVVKTSLAHYPWSFAKKTDALAELTNDRSQRWGYKYAKPGDCVKVRRILDHYFTDYIRNDDGGILGGAPYDLEQKSIYTDVYQAYCEYTFLQEDVGQFSDLFVEAVSFALATRISMPLTRDPNIRAGLAQEAIRQLNVASAHDANEQINTSITPAEHITART